MKKSYNTEILILICIALAGALMTNWIGFIGGLIIIFLTSYFLITKLKEQVILEYLK